MIKIRNPNGFGSVIKLGGNRRKPFAVRITTGYTDDGKQIYKYLSYHANRNDALIALAQYNNDPFDPNASNITFKNIYDAWSAKAYNDMSKNREFAYKSAYKKCESIHNKVFKDLRKIHLETVIDQIDKPNMKVLTKFLFTKLYRYAMENEIVNKDHSKFIKVKEPETQKEYHIFSRAEIKLLWENIDSHAYSDVPLILLYTGMRIGELLAMDKENVHIDERYMIGGLKTEAGIDRVIPIHKDIMPLIQKRMTYPNSKVLIPNKKDMRTTYSTFRRRQWNVYMEKLGMNYTPHVARHTFISRMDKLGINPITIRRIVGHANKSVTEVYTHKSIEDLIEAIDKLKY